MDATPHRKRMKLALEAIEVSSFVLGADESVARGTVKAHGTTYEIDNSQCGPCGQSYGFPCDTIQWQETCYTCSFTCSRACQSYQGYLSCGGSCDHTNCYEGGCTGNCQSV